MPKLLNGESEVAAAETPLAATELRQATESVRRSTVGVSNSNSARGRFQTFGQIAQARFDIRVQVFSRDGEAQGRYSGRGTTW